MKVIDQYQGKNFMMYNGDCVEVTKELPSDSIHYSIFSPPFASLYTYSNSERDMGNCKSDKEFYENFKFIVKELYRITMPGRLVSFHCMDIPAMKERDGYIGLKDFPGDLIKIFIDDEAIDIFNAILRLEKRRSQAILNNEYKRALRLENIIKSIEEELKEHQPSDLKFIYHSRVSIWKDPLIEATRTKALGLMHKQLCKDSAMCRNGLPDYLITMRKPGENLEPISRPDGLNEFIGEDEPNVPKKEPTLKDSRKHRNLSMVKQDPVYSHHVWRRYASPVWMDINQSNTLQKESAREDKDERHICLKEGTLVLTQRGYIPIEKTEIGDLTLTHKGNWKPIIAKELTRRKAEVVQIHAQGVPNLIVTLDHKIWVREGRKNKSKKAMRKSTPGWVKAEDLSIHYVNQKLTPIIESNISEKEWWIIGRWLADGHIDCRGRQYFISVGKNKQDGFKLAANGHIGAVNEKETAIQIGLINLSKEAREVLSRSGKGAANKQLTLEGLTLNEKLSESLLQGYLSGDGHKTGNQYSASSVSRPLLLGMAIVAQRARGVIPSIFAGKKAGKYKIEGRTVDQKQLWVLSWRENAKHNYSEILDDGAWKRVNKIEKRENADVWSIRVADDESFTAEGCIVKNCPLQLDVIARGIELWTNPNDIVFSPFAGIGSEIYQAIKMKRRGIGIELKESYYQQAVKNCIRAENETYQATLLDLLNNDKEGEGQVGRQI